MCGRFVIAGNKAAIRDAFRVDETFQDELKPSWNVAPMQDIPFVAEQLREGELVRRLEVARWGLVPAWAKDPKTGARILCTSQGGALDKGDVLMTTSPNPLGAVRRRHASSAQ